MVHSGNGVSKGIALGCVYVYEPFSVKVQETTFPQSQTEQQLSLYTRTVLNAKQELMSIRDKLMESDPEKAKIFTAHMDILEDDAMDEEVRDAISYDYFTPDWAVEMVYEKYAKKLSKAKDPLIRERAADMKDVKNRLLRCWYGVPERNISALEQPVIIAAYDLLPSDTATLDRSHVLGIVTEIGGATSHSAIIAKSYGIPAVLGIPGLLESISQGTFVILDATKGLLITDPSTEQQKQYEVLREEWRKQESEARQYLDKPPITKDGVRVDIGLNIGSAAPSELEGESFTDFVGLFRTEFLYMGSDHSPTEDEQFLQYKAVLTTYGERPVTLRTLDIGGDKTLPYLPMPKEDNPFLGKRALRLCFDNLPLFKTQLRAALRASVYGNLWIMLPMVGSLDDIRKAKAVVQDMKDTLDNQGIPYSSHVKLGVMIEIPSIALLADKVATEVDFASIGTNDLCQYLTAVDRMNPQVNKYYQSYHPSMFRLMGYAIDAFVNAGKPISVCGELGGDILAAPILVGLGLRKLSMSFSAIPSIKKTLAALTIAQMQELAKDVRNLDTAAAVEQHTTAFLNAYT